MSRLHFSKARVIDHARTGASMRKKRLALGKSLRQTAAAMGISAAYLSDLELGRRNWTARLASSFLTCL